MPSARKPRRRFHRRAIEASIVGNDQIGGLDQGLHPSDVDQLAGHHGVRDTADVSGFVEAEGDDPDLDDFVLTSMETSRLGIDNCAPPWKARAGCVGDGTRLQLPRNAIATRLFKPAHHVDLILSTLHAFPRDRLDLRLGLPCLPRTEQAELLLHADDLI